MNRQKRKRVVVRVRQPSFLGGIARLADITNTLGNDYVFAHNNISDDHKSFIADRDFVKESRKVISADWIRVCGDLDSATAKMERKYHNRLKTVSSKNLFYCER